MKITPIIMLSSLLIFYGCSEPDEVIETSEVTVIGAGPSFEEGINGSFTFRLAERLSTPLEVNFTISGTATNDEDYMLVEEFVMIEPNTLTAKIVIEPITDLDEEGDETIAVKITNTNNPNVTIGIEDEASIDLIDGPSQQDIIIQETRRFMANQTATDETVSLFYNLIESSSTGFIVGQHNAFSSFYGDQGGASDIKKSTGQEPGLLGSDFMFVTDDENDRTSSNWFYQQQLKIKEDALNAYQQGMVNIFAWHFREPYEGESFYTGEMTDFQKNNAFRSILPGGENHEYFKSKLDIIADMATSITGNKGEPIPIIFRPFHEFDGDWFWWGKSYCTPQEFIQVWRFMVNYLTNDRGVNNLLFAYSPDSQWDSEAEYLERYPGDSYVDVLGMDNYADFNNAGLNGMQRANAKLKIISELGISKGKPTALTESCFAITPGQTVPIAGFYNEILFGAMTDNDLQLSFMMFWSNNFEQYCTPPPGQAGLSDFMQFVDRPQSLLQNDIPNMYTITISGS